MSDAPGSPTARRLAQPGWLDPRLVLGVLLVLVSVVVGARVLSSADRTTFVWVAAQDLAGGSTLTRDDVERREVRLSDADTATLLRAPQDDFSAYEGSVSRRPIDAGEFIPLRALRQAGAVEERQFTLNIAVGHAPPDLDHGDLVDVYVTPTADGAAPAPTPGAGGAPVSGTASLVLAGVTVERGFPGGDSGFGGGDTTAPVVLDLARADVLKMVQAVARGTIDLVRVRGAGNPPVSASPAAAG